MTDSADSAMRRPPQQTRETIRRYQQRSLQKLLQHVWEHSPFYRDYYANCGIRQKDLPHLTVRDLPLLSKQGAVPLSRETGFSPWEEGRDTKGVLRDSRYGL
jgi:hypothetical protein